MTQKHHLPNKKTVSGRNKFCQFHKGQADLLSVDNKKKNPHDQFLPSESFMGNEPANWRKPGTNKKICMKIRKRQVRAKFIVPAIFQ
ncbi:hypothetical protein CEXT_799701 [Caerostris extrusa]|uniref:Uncharacterized protein n=1 Tax=Caerostris extrusa TaxID=172846 RepID=A0AAV4WED6_CAEEX|nr:hypothetical protein CEXT_799701 [Caerostris extrusa]